MLAHADSSGIQYEPTPTTVTGHNQSIPEAKNGGATASSAGGSEGSESESSTGASGGSPTTGNGGGSGQGSPANGSSTGQNTGGTPATGAGPSENPAPVSNQTPADSGGGSSPLVPILIAIAALAAISIGAVVIRQRRQGSSSTFSPKAG